jgi:hypothetical protein
VFQEIVEWTVKIDDERLDPQRVKNVARKVLLPPEQLVFIKLPRKARTNNQIDAAVACEFVRRRTYKQRLRCVIARDVRDLAHAFRCDGDRAAGAAGIFRGGQYLNRDLGSGIGVHGDGFWQRAIKDTQKEYTAACGSRRI